MSTLSNGKLGLHGLVLHVLITTGPFVKILFEVNSLWLVVLSFMKHK